MRVLGITLPSGKKLFCDKRCHTTTNPHRECICGGQLRGRGEAYARHYAPKVICYVKLSQRTKGRAWLNPQLVTHLNG